MDKYRFRDHLKAVQVVAGYGVAHVRHMQADLMSAPCQRRTAQQAPRPAPARAVRKTAGQRVQENLLAGRKRKAILILRKLL